MAYADKIFKETAKKILKEGFDSIGTEVRAKWPSDKRPAHTLSLLGVQNTYDLRKSFPILTVKPVNIQKCVDEMLWIYQKKSNDVNQLNSKIWDQWKREDGTIGKAYGYQIAKKHKYIINGEEVWMDQMDKVLYDIQHNPSSRRIKTTMYNPEDLHDMALAPCAYGTEWFVQGDTLHLKVLQRSQDMLVANGWNVVGYACLLIMVARHCNLIPGTLIHSIGDCHIYDRHIEPIKEIIQRKDFKAPTLWVNPEVKNFYDFKPEDFQLKDYNTYKFEYFEVAE